MKIRRALISVSDKSGVVEFARKLRDAGVEIVSTGGTMKALKEAGAEVSAVYVDGAEHEGSFWSPEVRGAIYDEIMKRFG